MSEFQISTFKFLIFSVNFFSHSVAYNVGRYGRHHPLRGVLWGVWMRIERTSGAANIGLWTYFLQAMYQRSHCDHPDGRLYFLLSFLSMPLFVVFVLCPQKKACDRRQKFNANVFIRNVAVVTFMTYIQTVQNDAKRAGESAAKQHAALRSELTRLPVRNQPFKGNRPCRTARRLRGEDSATGRRAFGRYRHQVRGPGDGWRWGPSTPQAKASRHWSRRRQPYSKNKATHAASSTNDLVVGGPVSAVGRRFTGRWSTWMCLDDRRDHPDDG